MSDEKGMEQDPVEPEMEPGSWMPLGPRATTWIPLTEPGEWVAAETLLHGEAVKSELERWKSRLTTIETTFEEAVMEQAGRLASAQLGVLSESLARIADSYERSVESVIDRSVAAILEVSEVVVRRAVTESRASIEDHVRRCLTERTSTALRVRVGSEDWTSVASVSDPAPGISWSCDSELKRGDVVIEYEDGRLSCTVVSLLESFRDELQIHMSELRETIDGIERHTSVARVRSASGVTETDGTMADK